MVDVAKVIPGVHASILKIYSHVRSHFCADATLDLVACETRQQPPGPPTYKPSSTQRQAAIGRSHDW
jgi:hypothetical protein